jgi:transcriptional regulator GlxA family with amidase domain
MKTSEPLKFPAHRYGGSTRQIAIFSYENCSFLDVGLIIETFDLASQMSVESTREKCRYVVSLLSSTGGWIQCSSEISIETCAIDPQKPGRYDALFVAGGEGVYDARTDLLTMRWLANVFPHVRTVQASGDGVELLRAAGLPSGRGTVVPIRADVMQKREAPQTDFPFTDKGGSPIITALAIVRSDLGHEIAESIAEQLMPNSVQWMASLFEEANSWNIPAKIKEAARWIEQNCERAINVEAIAQYASMGERTFLRHFKAEMGTTPSEYLLQARLSIACGLLVTTSLPVEKIARRCGMGNGIHLAKVFKRRLGMSATEYRNGVRSQSSTTGNPELPCS